MKCPKCGYTSFDYLKKCKKCGELLDDSRKALNLEMNEPTLFAGLKDEPLVTDKPEVDKTEKIDYNTSSEAAFSPPVTDPLPDSPPPPTSAKRDTQILSEDISSGSSSEFETLSHMDDLQPRQEETGTIENLPDIELGSIGKFEDLELTPSFSADGDKTEASSEEERNKEAELVLFEDEDKGDLLTDAGGQLENDPPLEFSVSDLENDISLSVPSDTTDKDMIELELDMEDEESLDQILADLGKNDSSKK